MDDRREEEDDVDENFSEYFCELYQEEVGEEGSREEVGREGAVADTFGEIEGGDQRVDVPVEIFTNDDEQLLYSVSLEDANSRSSGTDSGDEEVNVREDPIYDEFTDNDKSFTSACHELMNTIDNLSINEGNCVNDDAYLKLCGQIKNIFQAHNGMMDVVVRINNRLKDKMLWYKGRLEESVLLNRRISDEISHIRDDLSNSAMKKRTIFSITNLI